ncbi:MAG TPA: hypothetical protein VNX47_03050 [Nevskia sp.]|nr:hypothetical protein [Nevskia sp.]
MNRDGESNALMMYSLSAFANDGTLDADELDFIKRLALRDGVIDADERVVLSNIFSRVPPEKTSAEVLAAIGEFKQRFDIG